MADITGKSSDIEQLAPLAVILSPSVFSPAHTNLINSAVTLHEDILLSKHADERFASANKWISDDYAGEQMLNQAANPAG